MKFRIINLAAFVLLLLEVATVGAVSADFTNYQSQASFQTYYSSSDIATYWPIMNQQDDACKGRQDLILSVAPGGCEPGVVRSDLLADQNVPVFCQIDALQINPLIDIKQIKNIRFSGNYPKEVVGTGFYPARAALRTRDTLLGSPLINNIGYVVVILKKATNETSLPSFVNVTLSAQIEYDAGNALGIGRAQFSLNKMSDEEWKSEKAKQSFWNGKYYVRLVEVDDTYATVAIYDGDRVVSTTKVKKGETSRDVYMPGSFCMAAVQVAYDGFEAAKPSAVIKVSDGAESDTLQVYDGSSFANDKCRISNLQADTNSIGSGSLTVTCGSKSAFLNLTALKSAYNAGDRVLYNDGKTFVDATVTSVPKDEVTTYTVRLTAGDVVVPGVPVDKLRPLALVNMDFKDFAGSTANSASEFNDLIALYESIARDYPSEKPEPVSGVNQYSTFGEAALAKAISLSEYYRQFATTERLIKKSLELYPKGVNSNSYSDKLSGLSFYDMSMATAVFEVDGSYKTVQLMSMKMPKALPNATFAAAGMEFTVKQPLSTQSGTTPAQQAAEMGKVIGTLPAQIRKVEVSSIAEKSASVRITCAPRGTTRPNEFQESYTFNLGEEKKVCDTIFMRLNNLGAENVAKIRLLPKTAGTETETNLSVRIGIEKRGIKLSPDKTKEMIKNLNESIEKWDAISTKLANVVKGMKAICFTTALALQVKTFISGIGGTAMARQDAMSGDNGWTKRCQNAINTGKIDRNGDGTAETDVQYKTLTQCFSMEDTFINGEIRDRTNTMSEVNSRVAGVEKTSGVSTTSLLGGKSVNTEEATKAYYQVLAEKYNKDGVDVLSQYGIKDPATYPGGNIPYTYNDLRTLDYDLTLSAKGLSSGAYGFAGTDAAALGSRITETDKIITNANTGSKDWGGAATVVGTAANNLKPAEGYAMSLNKNADGSYSAGNVKLNGVGASDVGGATTAMRVSATKQVLNAQGQPTGATETGEYLLVGNMQGNQFVPSKVYTYTPTSAGQTTLTPAAGYSDLSKFSGDYQIKSFENIGQKLQLNAGNRMQAIGDNTKVIYFASGPDKGLAQRVPIDVNNGWYVQVDSSLNVGSQIAAYDSSGMPKVWKICNVNKDGIISSDDKCQRYGTGDGNVKILDMTDSDSSTIIQRSREALRQANNNPSGAKTASIFGQNLAVGAPANVFAGTECQQFMDIQDCNIMFNVCDPVICPATRCNLGGDFPVSDVIATGIIGGAVLCLPNFGAPSSGGVVIPVCLSGIQAGIDSYVSILKNHRDCLQNSLDTGSMTGICDEIYSVYMCEFFWRQIGPFASSLIPKLIEKIYTGSQGTKGGGEYLTVQKSWDNTQSSINYFTQSYAVNSLKAFQVKSIEEAGTEICKAYVSAKGPSALESLIEPDSPPQFYAFFSATKYTDATVPATSQYKVFYHIFAGKSQGVYYSIYLKSPPDSPYYSSSAYVPVASGFAKQGEYVSETKDFTAPEGYKELCVRINNEEKCGFKEVSTDYGLNYLKDKYVADQAKETKITTESGCISGSPSVGALGVNLNPQAMLEEAAFPSDYNRGLVRVCATDDPAGTTEPGRYTDVGYCGDTKLRCWLDTKSVKNAIQDLGLQNKTISAAQAAEKAALEGKGLILTDDKAIVLLKDLNDAKNKLEADTTKNLALATFDSTYQALIDRINSAEPMFYRNDHKAFLQFIKAQVVEVGVRRANRLPAAQAAAKTPAAGNAPPAGGTGGAAGEGYSSVISVDFLSSSSINYRFDRTARVWQYDGGFGWNEARDMGFPYTENQKDIARRLATLTGLSGETDGIEYLNKVRVTISSVKITNLPEVKESSVVLTADPITNAENSLTDDRLPFYLKFNGYEVNYGYAKGKWMFWGANIWQESNLAGVGQFKDMNGIAVQYTKSLGGKTFKGGILDMIDWAKSSREGLRIMDRVSMDKGGIFKFEKGNWDTPAYFKFDGEEWQASYSGSDWSKVSEVIITTIQPARTRAEKIMVVMKNQKVTNDFYRGLIVLLAASGTTNTGSANDKYYVKEWNMLNNLFPNDINYVLSFGPKGKYSATQYSPKETLYLWIDDWNPAAPGAEWKEPFFENSEFICDDCNSGLINDDITCGTVTADYRLNMIEKVGGGTWDWNRLDCKTVFSNMFSYTDINGKTGNLYDMLNGANIDTAKGLIIPK